MIHKGKRPETPLVLVVLLSLLGLLTAGGFAVSLAGRPQASPLLTLIVALGLALVILLVLYFFFFIDRGLVRLHRSETSFIESEIGALKISISELARGNLSIRTLSAPARGEAAAGAPSGGKTIAADGRGGRDNRDGRYNRDSRSPALASRLIAPLYDAYNELTGQIRESVQEFNIVTDAPCRRLFYVGADSFREGKKCGEAMGRLLKGKGQVAVIQGSDMSAAQSLRKKGFQAALVEEFREIEVVAVRRDHEDPTATPLVVRELLESFPGLAGLYVTQGSTPQAAAQAVLDAFPGAAVPPVKIVTHDLTPATASHLARGAIAATFSQNPFAQGYDPLILLYNYLLSRENPVIIRRFTVLEEITPANYREHWDSARGSLVSEKTKSLLARPLENKKEERYKIAAILPNDTGFWEPVAAGVRRAAEVLEAFQTTVKPVLTETIRRQDWSAGAFIPVIQSLIDEGYQAISLPVFDRELVPFINRQVERGVAVATYNSEPLSLRGLIVSVNRHAGNLFKVSEGLAAGAAENTQAINQISTTMKLLLIGSLNQIQHLSRTDGLIQELSGGIIRVKDETGESIKTAGESKRTSQAGYEIVREAQAAMQALGQNSQATTAAIRSLNDNVMKINEIIAFIEDIAAQTNLLAINASIQAAQAGEEGKGFSVVAAEIRKLAEQAGKATADVTELIKTILVGVERATGSVMAGMEQVSRSVAMADRTEEAFREITRASEENEAKVEAILDESRNMLAMSGNVKRAMAELIQLNQANGSAVEETTSSVVEMSAEINEIAKAAQFLKDMGRSLEDLLAQFILE